MIFDPISTWKKTYLEPGTYTVREILVPIFQHGTCVYESPSVGEIKEYCQKELNTLWDETRRLVNPHNVYVDLSQELYDLKHSILDSMSDRTTK